MKIRIASLSHLCVISLEAEPLAEKDEEDIDSSFFTIHASAQGAEATLFLRAKDFDALYKAMLDYLFYEGREIQE